jgi:hypothetical protein
VFRIRIRNGSGRQGPDPETEGRMRTSGLGSVFRKSGIVGDLDARRDPDLDVEGLNPVAGDRTQT